MLVVFKKTEISVEFAVKKYILSQTFGFSKIIVK